jgi:hypothetical protein
MHDHASQVVGSQAPLLTVDILWVLAARKYRPLCAPVSVCRDAISPALIKDYVAGRRRESKITHMTPMTGRRVVWHVRLSANRGRRASGSRCCLVPGR